MKVVPILEEPLVFPLCINIFNVSSLEERGEWGILQELDRGFLICGSSELSDVCDRETYGYVWSCWIQVWTR